MILAVVIALVLGAVLFFIVVRATHLFWVAPARVSLRRFETLSHIEGESFEVLFTPYEPATFVHDPSRENYTLTVNDEGFSLRASFPCTLYSRFHPLYFPWETVRSVECRMLTNLLVKVAGREEGFYLYAGMRTARRFREEFDRYNERVA